MDIIKKYNLDKSTWTYKGFHGVLHIFFPVGTVGIQMRKFFGDSNKITLVFFQNNYGHWYWNDNDLDRIVRYCEKDTLAVANLLLKYKGDKIIPIENLESV